MYSRGWGSIQEWGCIQVDTVVFVRIRLFIPTLPARTTQEVILKKKMLINKNANAKQC